MTTRREYVEALLRERDFKNQTGQDPSEVETELARFNSGALGEVIEAAIPGGLAKPSRTKKRGSSAAAAGAPNGGGTLPPPPGEGTSAGDANTGGTSGDANTSGAAGDAGKSGD